MNIRAIVSAVALVAAVWSLPATAQDHPVPAKDAPAKMTLPEGFHATLFAGEPDVVQPIAFTIDDRGRLWVAECFSYPKWHKDPKDGKDRILIFEDTDGDGRFDKRTVFADKLANVSGIQLGFGGVWVCSTPNLAVHPHQGRHGCARRPAAGSARRLGPQGGAQRLQRPDLGPRRLAVRLQRHHRRTRRSAAPARRTRTASELNCGVWRYHPTTKKFEAVAHGTTNPWGLDFDEHGEMFITNCVIEHLWHVIPGGHYKRMYGQDINPHSYGLMESCADHIHWGRRPLDRIARRQGRAHPTRGGGHAHVGCMIYLGDNWPERYRGGVFTCNLHGNRINHDILERHGSGYVARHGKDFMLANDPWFRGLALQYGPDGGVYVTDWTDTGECHNYKVVDRSNGRIYKITHGKTKPFRDDLAKWPDTQLAFYHGMTRNEWLVRHARRILQERASQRKIDAKAVTVLDEMLRDEHNPLVARLHALQTLYVIQQIDPARLRGQLDDPDEHIRAWAVRLLMDKQCTDPATIAALCKRARQDTALVRLHLASGLSRADVAVRFRLGVELVKHPEDATDACLPLMVWYAVEPIVAADPVGEGWPLLLSTQVPLVREYLARRFVAMRDERHIGRKAFEYPLKAILVRHQPAFHRDLLRGIQTGLSGQRQVAPPDAELWDELYPVLVNSPLQEVRERALALALQFNDPRAWQLLEAMALDGKAPATRREFALQTLLFQQNARMMPMLKQLINDPVMRRPAVRALAAFDSQDTPALVLKYYVGWSDEDKADALQTLTSRPRFALALLDAIAAKQVARTDVSAFTIRQMLALKSKQVTQRVEQVWGKIRAPAKDRTAVIAKYKSAPAPAALKKANLATGRALFGKHCASCHRLFGEGGNVGPELTGSQRANLDYVLENLVDPSAIVARDYQVSIVATTSGRVLTGIIKAETPQAITVQTQNEQVVVPKNEIDSRTVSPLSMMPEGLLNPLRMEEVRDLVAYLASPVQVPLPGQRK